MNPLQALIDSMLDCGDPDGMGVGGNVQEDEDGMRTKTVDCISITYH